MQKYQVFIDEHFISFSEEEKSIQQFETVFELINPDPEDMEFVVRWLSKEKETTIAVRFITNEVEKLWEIFTAQLKLIKAAGGVVRNENREVLFIFRLKKWDLPKGKMEDGETPEESALREVEEECGISNLELGKQLPDTFHIYFHKDAFVLKQTYWFEMNYFGKETLIPQKEEAIEKAVWIKTTDLKEQLSNTYSSLKPIIEML